MALAGTDAGAEALRPARLVRNHAGRFGNPRHPACMPTHSCAHADILAFFAGGAFALTERLGLGRQAAALAQALLGGASVLLFHLLVRMGGGRDAVAG